ncbi:unnamed protein product [Cercopithifilaria johnstoni]|uniref:Uncharacterized protein n=1 Tax=Cercopithifilaria johnstoni TaxID=2874296 RepID=A0A8J2MA79_9BILA|nr:unnamed protein product [Cercopithifilaria johnstoni]
MIHQNSLKDQWKDGGGYMPEIMESLLSKNRLIKAIAITFMFFLSYNNFFKRVTVQQQSAAPLIESYDQYADEEDIEYDDAFGIQPNITNTFQDASNDMEQTKKAYVDSTLSLYYDDESEKLIEDDMTKAVQEIKLNDEIFTTILNQLIITEIPKTILLDENYFNLSTFTTIPILPTTITTKIISDITANTTDKYKKYKIKAYIENSFRTFTELPKVSPKSLNVADFPNSTDALSSSNTTDNILSFGRNTNSETPIIRHFPTSNNLAITNSEFIESNGENDINPTAMAAVEFTANSRNLQRTTISQENMMVIDEEIDAEIEDEENEDEEDDYEYEDTMYKIPTVNIISSSITTLTTTTTTATITTTTSVTVSNDYDHRSPIIVTALFDIGRGKWPRYTRTYEQYMHYLKNLLKLKNCLVIYTDTKGAQFVRQMRNSHNTQIFEMSMHDLPLYRYRDEMESIIRREQEDWQFGPKTRYHPEANSADYNIIVNSKPYFLYNATLSSRFRASNRMFAWFDAGYGHGREGIIPNHCHWQPNLRRNRMTIIKLTPTHDKVSRYSITDLYRVDWVVLSGGFIAGDSHTINRFYRFYQKSFMELLDSGRIDDDQTVLTLMLKHYATLFNPITSNGDWYAVFRLFPCHDQQ